MVWHDWQLLEDDFGLHIQPVLQSSLFTLETPKLFINLNGIFYRKRKRTVFLYGYGSVSGDFWDVSPSGLAP